MTASFALTLRNTIKAVSKGGANSPAVGPLGKMTLETSIPFEVMTVLICSSVKGAPDKRALIIAFRTLAIEPGETCARAKTAPTSSIDSGAV